MCVVKHADAFAPGWSSGNPRSGASVVVKAPHNAGTALSARGWSLLRGTQQQGCKRAARRTRCAARRARASCRLLRRTREPADSLLSESLVRTARAAQRDAVTLSDGIVPWTDSLPRRAVKRRICKQVDTLTA
jgi:hypothetical protein